MKISITSLTPESYAAVKAFVDDKVAAQPAHAYKEARTDLMCALAKHWMLGESTNLELPTAVHAPQFNISAYEVEGFDDKHMPKIKFNGSDEATSICEHEEIISAAKIPEVSDADRMVHALLTEVFSNRPHSAFH